MAEHLKVFDHVGFFLRLVARNCREHRGGIDGKVVRVADNKMFMKSKDDREHSHSLAANAQITCDNAVCKLEALKEGMRIRVTTKKSNEEAATRIEALIDNVDFMKRN